MGKHGKTRITGETPAENSNSADNNRRGFLARVASLVVGGICGLVPVIPGLAVLLDPIRRKGLGGSFIRVGNLDSVPDDGIARQFPVIADRRDAWNTFPQDVIGSIYLRREPGSDVVECLNATCPHAGCMVDYFPADKFFQCPCHVSRFEPNGKRISPESCPSPRDMDPLRVDAEKLRAGEIWVEYKDFQTARPDRKER